MLFSLSCSSTPYFLPLETIVLFRLCLVGQDTSPHLHGLGEEQTSLELGKPVLIEVLQARLWMVSQSSFCNHVMMQQKFSAVFNVLHGPTGNHDASMQVSLLLCRSHWQCVKYQLISRKFYALQMLSISDL